MKTTITSNTSKVSARYRNIARRIPSAVSQATASLANDAIELYEKTTETWQHQPKFTVAATPRGHTVETQDMIYKYIDKGTSVRRALMSKDFRAKTKVGVISSFKGAGGKLYVSRKLALPGIQARGFSNIILRRMQAKAAGRVREYLREATAGQGVGI